MATKKYELGVASFLKEKVASITSEGVRDILKKGSKKHEKSMHLLHYESDYDGVINAPCQLDSEIVIFFGDVHISEYKYSTQDIPPSAKAKCLTLSAKTDTLWTEEKGDITLIPPPKDALEVICDLSKIPIAFISRYTGCVYSLVYLESFHDNELRIAQFIKYVLDKYKAPKKLDYTFLETIKKKREVEKQYTTFMRDVVNRMVSGTQTKIHECQNQIATYYRGLNTKMLEMEKESCFLHSFKEKMDESKVKGQLLHDLSMLNKLVDQNKFTHFTMHSDCVKGYTSDIILNKIYRIGKFEIVIYLDGRIKCNNQTNKRDDYDHPHVNFGDPCWGNVNKSIPEMIRNLQFPVIFDFMHAFLSTYNSKNPYLRVESWGADGELERGQREANPDFDPTDICQVCGETGDNCTCEHCDGCDELIDNCTCIRCPITNNRIDDDPGSASECDGCEHLTEDGCDEY